MKNSAIFIILPSYNEESNISHITHIVDQGLSQYFNQYNCTIINIDSNSEDNTIDVFKATPTKFNKTSLICPNGLVGKGIGIMTALDYAYNNGGQYFLTLDSDLKSIEKSWIKMFFDPILSKKTDIAIPIYSRNRYEGNTTNHFCSPIIYACFGIDILQPIAGDFSFNRKLASFLLKEFSNNSDRQYGIDMFITLTSLSHNLHITQLTVGKKIHNPSFNKIVKIFEGEAETAFAIITKNRHKIIKNVSSNIHPKVNNGQITDNEFIAKPTDKNIKNIYNFAVAQILQYDYTNILPSNILQYFHKPDQLNISSLLWTKILSSYLTLLLTKSNPLGTIHTYVKSLTPLYLLRVLSYFNEIDEHRYNNADMIIQMQKKSLRSILTKTLFT